MKEKLFLLTFLFIGLKSIAQNSVSTISPFQKEVWVHTDKLGRLTINPDSVTIFQNSNIQIVDSVILPTNKDLFILKSELEKCKNLTFLILKAKDSIFLDFSKFPKLEKISLSFLYSEKQINQLVNTSTKIKTMSLSPPCHLIPNLFNFKNVETLYLNFLKSPTPIKIDSNICNLKSLKILAIDGYDLEYHSSIWDIPNLVSLRIHHSKKVVLPKKCTSILKHLMIENCGIIEVPKKMLGFDSLLLFQLENMEFEINGKYLINNFKNLKGFKCYRIRLNYFPKTNRLKYLEEIILTESYFGNYTANFKNNINLKRVYFRITSKKKIEKFPKNMNACINLEALHAGFDNQVIPEYFKEFKKLEFLSVYNPYSTMSNEYNSLLSYESVQVLKQIPNLQSCGFNFDKTWTEKQKEEMKDFQNRLMMKGINTNVFEKFLWYPFEGSEFKLYKS